MFELTDKVALITGSTKGIGKAIAEAMAGAGARVVISSRKIEACEKVAAEIGAAGGAAIAIPCNISHRDQLEALVEGTMSAWGRIDVLVCNAAANPHFGPSGEIPDQAFDKTMDTNVKSNLWLCHLVLPEMAEREDGAIIIVSSIAGLIGSVALGTYAITKAADMQIARNLAVEYGPRNVRVNCIAPGLIRTDFARALWQNPEILARSVRGTPLGRIGEPDEIAGAAVFLASAAGRYVTGQTIVIDGGVTIARGG